MALRPLARRVRSVVRRPGARAIANAALAVLGISILLLPWYRLDAYEPNGWDATLWLRAALVLAVLALALTQAGRGRGTVAPLAALALVLVAMRVALPPDFGFDFDGLEVPVERRFGAWVGLGAAVLALVAALALPRAEPPPRSGERRWRGPGW